MTISIYDERLSGANGYKPCGMVTWTFTTDAVGDVTEQTASVINGQISRVVTNPDDINTPTTLWGFTLKDEDDADLLCGAGANRDVVANGVSEQIAPCFIPAMNSKLTFTVANGGNAKKGVVKVYYT